MLPSILRLPSEVRLKIWEFVLGPVEVEPCICPSAPGTCIIHLPGGCCEQFDAYKALDNRILRVNRQIHDEVRDLMTRSPKQFVLCNGLCLENLFWGLKNEDRQWIKHVRVNLYVGHVAAAALEKLTGQHLLNGAEACYASFVRGALKCQGVRPLVNVTPLGSIEEDKRGLSILRVSLTLR